MVPYDAQIGLLREIAALSGLPLDEMLHRVLSRTASLLDLELGIFSRIEGDMYTVEAAFPDQLKRSTRIHMTMVPAASNT